MLARDRISGQWKPALGSWARLAQFDLVLLIAFPYNTLQGRLCDVSHNLGMYLNQKEGRGKGGGGGGGGGGGRGERGVK